MTDFNWKDVTRQDIEAFAAEAGVQLGTTKIDDIALSTKVLDAIDSLPDAQWEALSERCKLWSNSLSTMRQQGQWPPTAPKTPKKRNGGAKAKAADPAPPAEPAAEEGDEPEIAFSDQLEACKTKKAVIELCEANGLDIAFPKSQTLAKMKERALEAQADSCAAPVAEPEPKDEKEKVQRAKAQAKAKAAAGEGKTKWVPPVGKDYPEGTTARVVQDIIGRYKKKGITPAEAVPLFEKEIEKQNLNCANPKGRVYTIMRQCVQKELATVEDGRYYPAS